VAFEVGYTDQSHMIAEFRQFSSLTPHMLATERWFHPFIERAKSVKPALSSRPFTPACTGSPIGG
jgi:AraC-like DNA-binding protein